MNKYKTAMIRNYVVNGIPKAEIRMQSYLPLPRNALLLLFKILISQFHVAPVLI